MTSMTNIMSNDTTLAELPSCKDCFYWFPVTTQVEEHKPFGKCKRNPPAMVIQDGNTYSGQPIVADNDYCGEFLNKHQ